MNTGNIGLRKLAAGLGNPPQTQPLFGKDQVKNNAGGFVFAIDKFKRLERFLILGVEGNTFYQKGQALVLDNAKTVLSCVNQDPIRVVDMAVAVSNEGRAIKNDAALFVLAMVAGKAEKEGRKYALKNLHKVARTATHLFTFISFAKMFRGWGRLMKEAVGYWYNHRPVDDAAFQILKYRNREGWTHKDVFRLAHIIPATHQHDELFGWIAGKNEPPTLPTVNNFITAQGLKNEKDAVAFLKHIKVPWEFLPTELTVSKEVLKALIPNMPLGALIRQLGKLTAHGALEEMSPEAGIVCANLTNVELLRKSRIHPMAVLIAMKVYAAGKGGLGKLTWEPVGSVISALNKAFYLTFKNVEPTGKRIRIALDLSGSMHWSGVPGAGSLTCAEAAGAMALITANAEPNVEIYGFGHKFEKVPITPDMRLDNVVQLMRCKNFGSTDCALPMLHALKDKKERDAFIIYTDNETWYGDTHPTVALERYRKNINPSAKLAVVAFIPTKFSIADPNDPGSMDFVGFDTSTPAAISAFLSE